MVDVTEALESEFVTKELVKGSSSKMGVITTGGAYETDDYDNKPQRKLTVAVDIDGKVKKYRPNRDSIKNLAEAWGRNTEAWLGKKIRFSVISVNGQERIQALPMADQPQQQNIQEGN